MVLQVPGWGIQDVLRPEGQLATSPLTEDAMHAIQKRWQARKHEPRHPRDTL